MLLIDFFKSFTYGFLQSVLLMGFFKHFYPPISSIYFNYWLLSIELTCWFLQYCKLSIASMNFRYWFRLIGQFPASFLPVSCQFPASFLLASYQFPASFLPVSYQFPTSFLPVSYQFPTSRMCGWSTSMVSGRRFVSRLPRWSYRLQNQFRVLSYSWCQLHLLPHQG